jgi:hypothetical protein
MENAGQERLLGDFPKNNVIKFQKKIPTASEQPEFFFIEMNLKLKILKSLRINYSD